MTGAKFIDTVFEGSPDYPPAVHDDVEATVGPKAARRARLFVAVHAPRGQVLEALRMLGLVKQPPRTKPVHRDEFGNAVTRGKRKTA